MIMFLHKWSYKIKTMFLHKWSYKIKTIYILSHFQENILIVLFSYLVGLLKLFIGWMRNSKVSDLNVIGNFKLNFTHYI